LVVREAIHATVVAVIHEIFNRIGTSGGTSVSAYWTTIRRECFGRGIGNGIAPKRAPALKRVKQTQPVPDFVREGVSLVVRKETPAWNRAALDCHLVLARKGPTILGKTRPPENVGGSIFGVPVHRRTVSLVRFRLVRLDQEKVEIGRIRGVDNRNAPCNVRNAEGASSIVHVDADLDRGPTLRTPLIRPYPHEFGRHLYFRIGRFRRATACGARNENAVVVLAYLVGHYLGKNLRLRRG